MSVIEGIGDEILQFFACFIIILLVAAAWISTNTRESTLCTTLLILFTHWLQSRRVNEILRSQLESSRHEMRQQCNDIEHTLSSETDNDDSKQESSDTSTPGKSNSNQNSHEVFNDFENKFREAPSTCDLSLIKIKLKRNLNDSVEIVDGKLQDTLGDFKKRHFNSELSEGNTVMLLFRGRILDNSDRTLEDCGLHDGCVMHCVVRHRTMTANGRRERRHRSGVDLFMVILTVWGLMLVGGCYLRYHCPECFSNTATFGLFVLTGLYVTCLAGTCFPAEDSDLASGE